MYFANFSCITAIGAGTKMTMAGIDAEVSGCEQTTYKCTSGRYAMMSVVDDALFECVQMDTNCTESLSIKTVRCGAMLALAVEDLNERFPLDQKYPLIWLSSESGVHETPMPFNFLQEILMNQSAPVDIKNIFDVNIGRASGIYALELAHELLHQQGHDYVVIGGAESPWSNDWLEWLDQRGRLKHQYSHDAFSPGEGAGFLLLAKSPELARAHAVTGGGDKVIAFTLPGLAQSPSHWHNDQPHKGESLFHAILPVAEAMATLAQPVDAVEAFVGSQNGELFWAKEHGVAISRLPALLKDAEHYHPFEFTGDLGVLSGIFLLGYAAYLIETGAHVNALVYAMSDDSWRAAVGLYLDEGSNNANE